MKDKVIEIVSEILMDDGIEISGEINEDSNLRDLGLTSFHLATLTEMIEDEFGIDIFEEGIVYTIKDIISIFGNKAYIKGSLNRKYLSAKVFNDSLKLKALNNLVHPLVAIDFKNWLLHQKSKDFIFKEAAILLESGAYKEMDKIITISEHSKQGFVNTLYEGVDQKTGQSAVLTCTKDVNVVHYPVKKHDSLPSLDLNLSTKFNFLTVAQWGPRKNLHATIQWFVEEFIDNPDVGLVVKTFLKGGCVIDRYHLDKEIKSFLKKYKNRKCKVYFMHGDLSDEEMHALYSHDSINALVSLTHGEGFGLPLFEAAYSGLPVVATDWSGHLDFLYKPTKDKKGKVKSKPHFARVDYDLKPIPQHAVWDGVLQKDSLWAYPQQGSYKMKLREVYKDYDRFKSKAKKLQDWVCKNFEEQKQLSTMLENILGLDYLESLKFKQIDIKDLPKISLITSVYKAKEHIGQLLENVTNQTIFKEKCEWIILDVNPKQEDYEEKAIAEYIKKYPDNIVYKRLDEDPGVYGVWNMAVEMSSGEYITNVNCDDRRRLDAFEQQAKLLHYNKQCDLVYNDSFVVQEANQDWTNITANTPRYNFEQFSKEAMLRHNLPHNNPMWRKSLHGKYGYFNPEYKSAGDWDFWLRCTLGGSNFIKHPEVLGIYYFNPDGISTNPENTSWKKEEEKKIFKEYIKKFRGA